MLTDTARRQGRRRTAFAKRSRRSLAGVITAVLAVLALPGSFAASSHSQGDGPRDFAVGSGSNQFLFAIGEARLSVSAPQGPPGTRATGHVRAKGDPDGSGPLEPFKLEGEVTCLEVRGNRAAVKYRFKHAEGSAEPFEGGGVEIFLEDNGEPRRGVAVDRTSFDPPQPAGVFQPTESQCDDPSSRAGYDRIESGNFVVHDGTP